MSRHTPRYLPTSPRSPLRGRAGGMHVGVSGNVSSAGDPGRLDGVPSVGTSLPRSPRKLAHALWQRREDYAGYGRHDSIEGCLCIRIHREDDAVENHGERKRTGHIGHSTRRSTARVYGTPPQAPHSHETATEHRAHHQGHRGGNRFDQPRDEQRDRADRAQGRACANHAVPANAPTQLARGAKDEECDNAAREEGQHGPELGVQ